MLMPACVCSGVSILKWQERSECSWVGAFSLRVVSAILSELVILFGNCARAIGQQRSRAGGELVAHESAIAFAVRSVHASAGRADTWREHSCIAVRSIPHDSCMISSRQEHSESQAIRRMNHPEWQERSEFCCPCQERSVDLVMNAPDA